MFFGLHSLYSHFCMNRTENWRFKCVWSRVGVGNTQHIQEGDNIGPTMLQELQTLALVGLLVSTYYLTIGCRQIGASLPAESSNISDKVAGATRHVWEIRTRRCKTVARWIGSSSGRLSAVLADREGPPLGKKVIKVRELDKLSKRG